MAPRELLAQEQDRLLELGFRRANSGKGKLDRPIAHPAFPPGRRCRELVCKLGKLAVPRMLAGPPDIWLVGYG